MSTSQRVQQQPAYLLHYRPFRDTSLLLDVLSRDHGKLALVARGARSANSRLRGILRPFLPLRISWLLRSDLGTLTGAELDARPLSLDGEALLSAYYVNELLMHLLHRHDPHPEVFAAYSQVVETLAAAGEVAPVLRSFELELLRLLGYALAFGQEAHTQAELCAEANYEYRVDEGAVRVDRTAGDMLFSGAELIGVREQRFQEPVVLRAASRLLRTIIAYHLGGKELKSRKVLVELRRSRVRMAAPEAVSRSKQEP